MAVLIPVGPAPVSTPSTDVIPANFTVRRGYEGPQIIVSWDVPVDDTDITEFRLVRRLFGFPIDQDDGEIIHSAAPDGEILSDLDVEPCRCYYYRLFIINTTADVFTSPVLEAFIVPIQTGFFGPKLFNLLPELYKNRDKRTDEGEPGKLALVEGTDGITPEVYNFGEDGSVRRGELQRFLRLFGPALDEPKGLLDCLLNQLDVDEACIPNLEYLATLLDVRLNKELTPEKFRNEVRLQVEFLKLKGTKAGLLARIVSVSGITGTIREQCDDLLITNDLERTTYGFTAAEADSIGGPDDLLWYTVGYYDENGENPEDPFWLWFTLFLDISSLPGLDAETLRKWCISIDESSPACHRGFLRLTDQQEDELVVSFVDEAFTTILDSFDDALDPNFVDEILTDEYVGPDSLWLLVNEETDLTNTADYTAVVATPTT